MLSRKEIYRVVEETFSFASDTLQSHTIVSRPHLRALPEIRTNGAAQAALTTETMVTEAGKKGREAKFYTLTLYRQLKGDIMD